LFPERYNSDSFAVPNLIMIVDDAVRRGIDVCEGSIGWTANESGVEVMYLYDEAVDFSGITFVPSATCDSIYYVDSFDRKKFIRTDYIFSKAHEERLAELKYIAYSLGAKFCSIEIRESTYSTRAQRIKADVSVGFKGVSSKEHMDQAVVSTDRSDRSGSTSVEFQGSDTPQRPTLKWFAYDDNIQKLIEMRCGGLNAIRSETLELSGSSSATMSRKAAYSIDMALGKMGGGKTGISMDEQAEKEHQSKLLFHIEF